MGGTEKSYCKKKRRRGREKGEKTGREGREGGCGGEKEKEKMLSMYMKRHVVCTVVVVKDKFSS